MATNAPIIVWFRQNLRLHDNPVLHAAAAQKAPLLLIYIDDTTTHAWQAGAASRWWLHHSLQAFAHELAEKYQATLACYQGDPLAILQTLLTASQAAGVYWDRCYEPHAIARDTQIKKILIQTGIEAKSFNCALLTNGQRSTW